MSLFNPADLNFSCTFTMHVLKQNFMVPAEKLTASCGGCFNLLENVLAGTSSLLLVLLISCRILVSDIETPTLYRIFELILSFSKSQPLSYCKLNLVNGQARRHILKEVASLGQSS